MLYHGSSEEELVGMCISMGLTMKKQGPTCEIITTPAVTLRPTSTISTAAFEDLKQKQVLWNILIDLMARHPAFLSTTLKTTAESDREYTGRMLQMYHDVYGHPDTVPTQPAMLGIFRNDFMEDDSGASSTSVGGSATWKQVEINTISVSFAGLSPKVINFQRQVDVMTRNDEREMGGLIGGQRALSQIADSVSDKAVPEALGAASAHYVSQRPPSKYTPVVCFVVQEGERNTADQIALALEVERGTEVDAGNDAEQLSGRRGVRCIRRTLMQLHKGMKLVPQESTSSSSLLPPTAIIDDHYEVSVFYFRSCYAPDDFPTDAHWEVRRNVELAAAVKCPSLPHYLCTYKKVQQLISQGVHEIVAGSDSGNATSDSVLAKLFAEALAQYKRLPAGATPLLGANATLTQLSPVLDPTNYFSTATFNANNNAPTTLSAEQSVKDQVATARTDTSAFLARWVESNFVPIYSLNPVDNPLADETLVQDAIANSGKYVLKPMLEGAGKIYAREEMAELLRIPKPDEGDAGAAAAVEIGGVSYWTIRREYILMKRISVRQFDSLRDSSYNVTGATVTKTTVEDVVGGKVDTKASTLLRHGTIVPMGEIKVPTEKLAAKKEANGKNDVQDYFSTLVSELGVYGVVLTTGENVSSITAPTASSFPPVTVLHNKFAGYVVRSKPSSVEGGGVMAGAAFLDALQVIE